MFQISVKADTGSTSGYNAPVITLLLLLSQLAVAGDSSSRAPVRCDAVWTGPSTGCDLSGTWASTGFGTTEEAARAAASARLHKAMEAGSDALAIRYLSLNPNDPSGGPKRDACETDLAARIRYACIQEPELREKRLCFADLPEPDCWTGDPLLIQGTEWREMERGREQVCRDMEDQLRASNASTQQVATCRARCAQVARVRCPAGLVEEDAEDDRPMMLTEKLKR